VSSARGRGEVGDHEEVLTGVGTTGERPDTRRWRKLGRPSMVSKGQRRSRDPPVMQRGEGDVSRQGGAPGDGGFLQRTTQSANQR
jgi:hypothetical protein